jgi:hypothetical protein
MFLVLSTTQVVVVVVDKVEPQAVQVVVVLVLHCRLETVLRELLTQVAVAVVNVTQAMAATAVQVLSLFVIQLQVNREKYKCHIGQR